jgi:alkylation response protein AidB-like acyl-CoA dehydrogenase
MRELGVFGISIPQIYGGLDLDQYQIAEVRILLSAGWLSLMAMLGSHLRVCDYIKKFGTDE